MITEEKIKQLIISNDSLFRHVYVIQQKFDIIPKKEHFGVAINYVDLQECKNEFINELINTVVDWVYSATDQEKMIAVLKTENRTLANSSSEIRRKAFSKFRQSSDKQLIQGQFGELLLFVFLQRFFGAVPLLRKMPLTTSNKLERFGADAMHYAKLKDKHIFYLGEAKTYISKYKFNDAFSDAITSILDTYSSHRKELDSYLYQEFLESELEEIARGYKNSTLENSEVHLVSVITYNETRKILKTSELEIKNTIKTIIEERFRNYSNLKIENCTILPRLTYIVFPIWEFDSFLEDVSKILR